LRDPGRRQSARPYFLWVHLYDPHEPYAPPSPFRERFAGRLYDGEIAFVDELVGRLLDEVGFGGSQAPLVVVAGDHGESLGEHGESTHGLFVYDAAVHVPLIVAWPGAVTPSVVRQTVRLIDVAPTLADLAGLSPLGNIEGLSLRPLMSPGSAGSSEAPPAYVETLFPEFFMRWAPLRAVEIGHWKYIEAPEAELYDLGSDPHEQANVIAREPATAAALARTLSGLVGQGGGRMSSTPLTDEARQRLASLGYVSAAPTPARPGASDLPDPKRMAPLFERLLSGNRALAEGRAADAARIASEALVQDRTNAFARLLLGRAALALGNFGDALTALEAYVELVPSSADAHHWMALAALRGGDRSRALREEDAAIALDPRHGAALALKAGLLLSSGREGEGLELLRSAIERDPSNHVLRVELADLLSDARRPDEAEAAYRNALAARPQDGRALTGLGRLLTATGRAEQALDTLARALELDPRDEEARFERAEAYTKLGRGKEARTEYEHLANAPTRPDIRAAARQRLATRP
jgi:tetratricopeptide (TPR) repeat protein